MQIIDIREAKLRLLKLIEGVSRGEEIVISQLGHPSPGSCQYAVRNQFASLERSKGKCGLQKILMRNYSAKCGLCIAKGLLKFSTFTTRY